MPPDRRRILIVELAIVGFAAAAPGLIIGLQGLGDAESFDTDIAVLELLAVVAGAFGMAAVAWFLLWRDGALGLAGIRRQRPGFIIGWGLLGFACCVGALLVAANLLTVLYAVFDGDIERTTDAPDVDLTIGFAFIALTISVTAGVCEELIYRAYAITRMEQLGWTRAALVVPWAVWTAQHLYAGPPALLVIGAVGAPLVWLYRWKRSLWPVVVAHALYDIGIFLVNAAQN
jgi:membrane protease YdiL (CAAX protease family)